MKKRLELSVEEDLIKLAQSFGLNMSAFFEVALTTYLKSVPKQLILNYVKHQSEYSALLKKELPGIAKGVLRVAKKTSEVK